MNLSEDQILALAPDESSRKSGKELSNPSKWSNTGCNEKALWGECQGSGKNPYKTQVDLVAIAFKCSCPSRKFPCKHGLGILLLYSRQNSFFPQKESPDWVKEWMDKREEKAEKKQQKIEKPVDPEAQAKRQQQRLKKVKAGIEELQLLMKDVVRNGIVNMPEKASGMFENLAKRMIDSQAGGLAQMSRELAEINFFRDKWQSEFVDRLLRIYLVTEGFRSEEKADEPLSDEIRSMIGFTQSVEEIKALNGIKDEWFVLGRHTEPQEQLMVQRNWLMGTRTGQYALVLQFYVRSSPPELNLTPGTLVEAELCFYKALYPYRALVKDMGKVGFPDKVKGHENWKALAAHESKTYMASPFVSSLPYFINDLRLARSGLKWYLADNEGISLPLHSDITQLNKMLTISGGKSFSLALTGNEGDYRPLGILMEGKYFTL